MSAFLVKWTTGERSYDLHQQKMFKNHKDAVDFVESLNRSYEDSLSKLKSVSISNEFGDDFHSKFKDTAIKVCDCIDSLQNLKEVIKESDDLRVYKHSLIDASISLLIDVVNKVLQ